MHFFHEPVFHQLYWKEARLAQNLAGSQDYSVAILNSCLEQLQVGIITSHLLSSSTNKKQAIFRFGLVEGGCIKTIDPDPLLPHKGMILLKMLTR